MESKCICDENGENTVGIGQRIRMSELIQVVTFRAVLNMELVDSSHKPGTFFIGDERSVWFWVSLWIWIDKKSSKKWKYIFCSEKKYENSTHFLTVIKFFSTFHSYRTQNIAKNISPCDMWQHRCSDIESIVGTFPPFLSISCLWVSYGRNS